MILGPELEGGGTERGHRATVPTASLAGTVGSPGELTLSGPVSVSVSHRGRERRANRGRR